MKYSTWFNPFKIGYKQTKRYNKKLTLIDFIENIYDYLDFDMGKNDITDLDCNIYSRILKNIGVKHFFIENEDLFSFLLETKAIRSQNIRTLFDNHVNEDIIIVHHKKRDMSSIIFHGVKNKKGEKYEGIRIMEKKLFIQFNGDGFIDISGNQYGKTAHIHENFIHNFLMYINTFPESVIDSPPNEVKYDKGYTVKNHKSISSNGTISPHFRRGHFRFLSSDRFTKKKGNTVFVKPSFVKGEAKTVQEVN